MDDGAWLHEKDLSAGYETYTRERTVSLGAVLAWAIGLGWLATQVLYAVLAALGIE